MTDDLKLLEGNAPPREARAPWVLLVVDDEEAVHAVTELALRDFTVAGRPLSFLHAYSRQEGQAMLDAHPHIALVLLDVVMETEHAGLELVEYVRNVLKNRFMRIVLRTGQPGQAPELDVITRYDINDYRNKTELTRERLCSTVHTGLSAYRDLLALDANRRGLEKVIEASAHIFELRSIDRFAQGVLEQLTALLFLDRDAVLVHTSGVAAAGDAATLRIVAGIGAFAGAVGRIAGEVLPPEVMARLERARAQQAPIYGPDYVVGYQQGVEELIFYVGADHAISPTDRRLIEMFYRNVGIARETLRLLGAAHGDGKS